MGISGIGQNYYHNNVATARNTKNVNSTGKNDGFAGKVTEKNPVSPEDTKRILMKRWMRYILIRHREI